jgi:hypothetical protein
MGNADKDLQIKFLRVDNAASNPEVEARNPCIADLLSQARVAALCGVLLWHLASALLPFFEAFVLNNYKKQQVLLWAIPSYVALVLVGFCLTNCLRERDTKGGVFLLPLYVDQLPRIRDSCSIHCTPFSCYFKVGMDSDLDSVDLS